MSFDERLEWMLFGCFIGFVLGYIARTLRDIKEELDDVEKAVHKNKDEEGFVRYPYVMDIALLVVVVLTVWAAFSSQHASNQVQSTQRKLASVTFCNQQYLTKTVKALNERTSTVQAQAQANVDLQRAQASYIQLILTVPTPPENQLRAALDQYFAKLTNFVKINSDVSKKVDQFPYPTSNEILDCVDSAELIKGAN